MRNFVILSMTERDEMGRALRWNNEWGWVTKGCETVFTQEERRSVGLPIGGRWEDID